MIFRTFNQSISLIVAILCLAVSIFAQDSTVSVMSEGRWHKSPVDNAHMNGRIAEAAVRYKEFAPIPRIAFYDIGYPKDKAEFEALNGYGVLLIASLSQDGQELPIKRAYVVAGGKEYDLVNLKHVFAINVDSNSQIVKTFGQYRADSLFLFPVYLRSQTADLLIDFSKNRTGMKIATFEDSTPEAISQLPTTKPQDGKKIDVAIREFIKREYPGYTDK